MRVSLAFGSAGSAGRAVANLASPTQRSRHRSIDIRRSIAAAPDDVGLEALGQVLAEPGGFLDHSVPDGANDALDGALPGADARTRGGYRVPRRGATLRPRTTIAGGVEAAIVIALLAGGSAFAGYPIVRAVADSAPVQAMTLANAHVTETITAGGARAVVETTIRRVEPAPRS